MLPPRPTPTARTRDLVFACGALAAALVAAASPARGQDVAAAPTCLTVNCHDRLVGRAHGHAPVEAEACVMCHRPAGGAHEFRLARFGPELCTGCHGEMANADHPHTTMWDGGCTICHDPHGSGQPALLPPGDVGALCTRCHDAVRHAAGLHTPVAAGACTACHDPHVKSSTRTGEQRRAACLRCHDTIAEGLSAGTAHGPAASDCTTCHDPHGSAATGNLRAAVPDLCYACHDEMRQRLAAASTVHRVATEPGGCLQCHDPHASPLHAALRADPLTLCARCHGEPVAADDGHVVAPIVAEIEQSAFAHGPVRQRNCAGCHDSHSSKNAMLLAAPYTPEFYEPFDLDHFGLCFSCHDQRGVLVAQTTTLTDFRNGSTNLHYLHVNRAEKGRTCRACHATHASDNPMHVRDWVEYGNWQLPIAFTPTETGGSCRTGCHQERAYDRVEAVPVTRALQSGAEP